jgi:hypothetical protein
MRLTAAPSAAPHWRAASMAAWFCDVGSTMRAALMRPPTSISYRCHRVPRGDSVAPNPVPARADASTAG